ncbi:MAG TPA: YdeI/OmpD-associated family protein [Pseudonocardiaceae bacterium]|nr:YdeI/OmpD-associated family protein [Pseudonocardiaceae bacterium]
MPVSDDLPVEEFASADDFEKWLVAQHKSSPGLWIRIAKKETGIDSVDYPQALDVALCHGWIDGQKHSDGETHWLQRFTPRGPRSKWSQVNREHAEELIKQHRMRPAGQAEVDRAKADGRWDAAYASQKNATVPDDLQQALDADNAAREFFATLDSKNRFAVLYRIGDAKKPETRAARIQKYVAMLHDNQKIYP